MNLYWFLKNSFPLIKEEWKVFVKIILVLINIFFQGRIVSPPHTDTGSLAADISQNRSNYSDSITTDDKQEEGNEIVDNCPEYGNKFQKSEIADDRWRRGGRLALDSVSADEATSHSVATNYTISGVRRFSKVLHYSLDSQTNREHFQKPNSNHSGPNLNIRR